MPMLKKPEKSFLALFNLIPDPAVILDAKGKILAVNIGAEEKTGFKREELVGKNFARMGILTAKSKAVAIKNLAKRMMGMQVASYELEFLAKDGRKGWGEVNATKIEHRGKPADLVIFRDITEHKRLEDELKRSSQFLESALDSIPETIFIKDRDFRYIMVNKACYELLGRSREEFLGRTDHDIFPREEANFYRRTDLELFEKGSTIDIPEVTVTDASGTTHIHRVKKAPLKDAKGNITHLIGMTRDVTERKRAEEEIRKLTQFHNLIIESANVWLDVLDEKSNVLIWNKAAEEISGYTRDEVIGHSKIWEWLYPDDKYRKEVTDKAALIIQGGATDVEDETTIRTKSGEYRVIAWHSRNLVDNNGVPMGSVALGRDVTERKRMEEALKESERKYRAIFETTGTATLVIEEDMTISEINTEFERLSGYTKREVEGKKSWTEFVVKDDLERMKEYHRLRRIDPSAAPRNYEFRFINKDGNVRDALAVVAMIPGTRMSIASMLDITERKQLEEKLKRYSERLEESIEERTRELKESEAKFRGLYDSIRDGILANDVSGRIFDCNKAFENMVGYSLEELRRMKWQDITPKHYLKLEEGIIKDEMLARGYSGYVEKEYIRKDGSPVPVEVSASVVKGTAGKLDMIWCVIRDITDRKRMEERLRRTERLAAIGETAAMVGHDLRNPLQVLASTIYLGKRKLESMSFPAKEITERSGLAELFKRIEEQVKYMNKIVSDLQDYARPLEPQLAETSVQKLINDTLSSITIPETVKLSIAVQEDFPKVIVDPALMKRAFANLITNALESMPEGGTLTIKASAIEEDGFITFQDTGVGIPEENLDELFTPFFTTKAKGMGFGLPISRRMVEAHGGSINVESKPGKGSTFTVKIPLRRR